MINNLNTNYLYKHIKEKSLLFQSSKVKTDNNSYTSSNNTILNLISSKNFINILKMKSIYHVKQIMIQILMLNLEDTRKFYKTRGTYNHLLFYKNYRKYILRIYINGYQNLKFSKLLLSRYIGIQA